MMSGLPDIIKFPIHKSAVADLCAGHDDVRQNKKGGSKAARFAFDL